MENEMREIKFKLPERLQMATISQLEWWSIENEIPVVYNDGEAYAVLAYSNSNDEGE